MPVISVLIVDDEQGILELLAKVLRSQGFEVACHRNPVEAAQLFATRSFSIVITDIDMPEMDGVRLARHCRSLNGTIPVILMSGKYEECEFEFLQKPFRAQELVASIKRLVAAA